MSYSKFLAAKQHLASPSGFEPVWMPDGIFDFQRHLVEWAVRKGRAALFADCGMGKTIMQLAFAENVVRQTNKPVLLLTPLAVGAQTVREAAKFGVDAVRCGDGKLPGSTKVIVANYERLHYFNPQDFAGTVCDESSILKNFDGKTKAAVTDFMRKQPYRLLCTATAAPNDYIELGTSSEALGVMGFVDMLGKFFKKAEATTSRSEEFRAGKYRFRGHAERDFWRWVCSWARALRKPSDLGFENGKFQLPPLITREHIIQASTRLDGFLFDMPAVSLQEQRQERRRTINERCEQVATLADTGKACVCWCHLNDESSTLAKLIKDGEEVTGNDPDEKKEETYEAFQSGQLRVIITKSQLAGFGLNWQHCAHQTFFPSHSFEQWYQSIRRSWRFGQTQPVTIDMVTSEGERGVLANLQRKAAAAEAMFANLVELMNNELHLQKTDKHINSISLPSWL